MKKLILLLLTTLIFGTQSGVAQCPPDGYSRENLDAMKNAGFELASPERNALAVGLLDCLGDPDPKMRDGIVYEGLATWLRGDLLEAATIESIFQKLRGDLAGDADAGGYLKPFAALVLSEVARTDRIAGTFTPERREELVGIAAAYLTSVRDYRGFSETDGWRHGVAHGADLVLQLILNDHINAAQIDRLITALAAQVAPAGEIFYVYGEPGRLARAIFYAYRRTVVDDERWQVWFEGIGDPAPFATWNDAYSSQAGLARRHNTLAFLMALHVYATASNSDQDKTLDAMVMKAIEKVW